MRSGSRGFADLATRKFRAGDCFNSRGIGSDASFGFGHDFGVVERVTHG